MEVKQVAWKYNRRINLHILHLQKVGFYVTAVLCQPCPRSNFKNLIFAFMFLQRKNACEQGWF